MRKRLAMSVPAAAFVVSVALAGSCGSGSSGDTAQPPVTDSDVDRAAVDVAVKNYAFEPGRIEVGSNARVVWTVQEGTHEVVATSGAQFDSGTLDTGNTFTWSPDFAGSRSISYECKIHPAQMTGTIQVNG